jgi:hypothetical protein
LVVLERFESKNPKPLTSEVLVKVVPSVERCTWYRDTPDPESLGSFQVRVRENCFSSRMEESVRVMPVGIPGAVVVAVNWVLL